MNQKHKKHTSLYTMLKELNLKTHTHTHIYIYIYNNNTHMLICCNKFLLSKDTVRTRIPSEQCTITQVQFISVNIILSANR